MERRIRDHAGLEIIDKVERGEFSHCRSPGTFRSDACLAGQSNETRRTDDAEEIRNRRGYGFARCARRGPGTGNSRRDETLLAARSAGSWALRLVV